MSRKKQKHHEEHIDESWLIPYSDLLTLLLALFIVLFASSQVDAKKLANMQQVFSALFPGNTGVMNHQAPVASNMPQDISNTPDAKTETSHLMHLQQQIHAYTQQNDLDKYLTTALTEDGLMIIIGEVALFPSGSDEILPEARKIADEIAKMLVAYPQKVTIAGHTDNVPINTREFPSNWDLSTKRSLHFMKVLLENKQLQPERFNATGYGEFRPVAPNATPDGRQKNRRVELLIQRIYKQ